MEPPYTQFTARDFVLDDAFRRWVFEPNEQSMTFWHTFMLKHPEQQNAIDEATSLLLHLNARYDDLTNDSYQRIWQVLEQAVSSANNPLPKQAKVQRFPIWGARVWPVAASLTGLLILAGTLIYFLYQPKTHRIHTAFGETQNVILPDGSTVLLNGNTTLTYAENWDDDKPREVWLDGEGYFKVAKKQRFLNRQSAAPAGAAPVKFVTHTPDLDITVLGTTFNVNTRRGNTDVMLVEGRVQLSRAAKIKSGSATAQKIQNQIIELKPGQLASSQPTRQPVTIRDEKPQLHTAWVQHQFVFDDTALSDIAQQLHDTYGIMVVFDDNQLARRRFTGNLSNESPETLLATLCITFDLTIRHDGDRIVLHRNP